MIESIVEQINRKSGYKMQTRARKSLPDSVNAHI